MRKEALVSKRIKNVLKKEWLVMFTDLNSALLVTLLPLLIVGQFILYIWLAYRFGANDILAIPLFQTALDKLEAAISSLSGIPDVMRLQVLLLSQFNFFLLLIPTMIAMNSAAFSIVEEKQSHSLEPLLATPVRTWELLLGKALSGALPAFAITWVCAGIFLLAITGIGWGNVIGYVITATWFMSLFLLTPAITLLSFMLGVIGSSRAKDAKSAQNIALVVIFPVFALVALQVTGLLWFTPLLMFALVLVIGVIDFFVLKIAVGLFQRESIVVKWR